MKRVVEKACTLDVYIVTHDFKNWTHSVDAVNAEPLAITWDVMPPRIVMLQLPFIKRPSFSPHTQHLVQVQNLTEWPSYALFEIQRCTRSYLLSFFSTKKGIIGGDGG